MKKLFKQFPFFAFLLPLFFVWHGYVQNYNVVLLQSALALAVKYTLIALSLFGLFFITYRTYIKAGLACFISLVFFLFFGAIHDSLGLVFDHTFLVRYSFLLPFLVATYLLLLLLLRKGTASSRFVSYLNILFVSLLLIDTVLLLKPRTQEDKLSINNCAECEKPDVHFIVVDGYAGNQQLKNDFGSSNEGFLDSLQRMGFKVLTHSTSNYVRTEFSMASILNMKYDTLADKRVTDYSLRYCLGQIRNAAVVKAFVAQGYSFINNSIFDVRTEPSPVGNFFLTRGGDLIESETLLERLKRDVYISLLYRYGQHTKYYKDFVFDGYHSDSVLYKNLMELPVQAQKPRLVYTHFLMTHFPYYYKQNGQLNTAENISLINYDHLPLYLDNLRYSNQRLLRLVRRLLDRPKPPVIVLVSDHGFRYTENIPNAFFTLGAIYLPNKDYRLYSDSLSNINQFPVLLNTLFNQQLPLAKDLKILNRE